jgi:ribonuclease HI
VAELSGPVEEEGLQGMRQVGGEIHAIYKAMEWCQEHSVEEVEGFYDYAGLEKWATGEWQAKNPATQAYAKFMRECPVSIRWRKVESHTGDRWNDRADQLAKRGARQNVRKEEGVEHDPLAVVRQKAGGFVEFLGERGIPASFIGIINDQYGRIVIRSREGYVDVYNTRRRPISDPYVHSFKDSSLKDEVRRLWRNFFSGGREQPTGEGFLNEASYYYGILEPYRDCDFDFIHLARALQRACERAGHQAIDAEALRLDFAKLETTYFELKGGDGP